MGMVWSRSELDDDDAMGMHARNEMKTKGFFSFWLGRGSEAVNGCEVCIIARTYFEMSGGEKRAS